MMPVPFKVIGFVSSTPNNKMLNTPLRWRPTLTTRPVLRQVVFHGVSTYVWCHSVTDWILLSRFSVLFV